MFLSSKIIATFEGYIFETNAKFANLNIIIYKQAPSSISWKNADLDSLI